VDTIVAPALPRGLEWANTAPLGMDELIGHPVLVEFWDFCRVNSLRTLPYLREWHARYESEGLAVIGVHSPGFPPSRDERAVHEAVARLQVRYPVAIDSRLEVWHLYENRGWPARYLWDERGHLHEFHYGEGAYADTERAIQGLLGVEREPLAPVRPEDDPRAELAPQSADRPGAYSGPYEAGGVWAVLAGPGTVTVNGQRRAVEHPGCHPLVRHEAHTRAVLDLQVGNGVTCHAVCFTPGIVR